jgi:hypothetical protein
LRISLEAGELCFGFSVGLTAGVFSVLGATAAGVGFVSGTVVFTVFAAVFAGEDCAILAFVEGFPPFGEVVVTGEVFVLVFEFAGTGICW